MGSFHNLWHLSAIKNMLHTLESQCVMQFCEEVSGAAIVK